MRGESYVADPIFPKAFPDGALVLAVPVRPAEGQEPIGVVEALLSLKPIKAKLDEEGRGGVLAYVVDRSGSLILTSDAVGVQVEGRAPSRPRERVHRAPRADHEVVHAGRGQDGPSRARDARDDPDARTGA